MQHIKSFNALEELGRVQLSDNFYMREFLYSEIANYHQISNIPENPDIAIEAGKQLCKNLLEPLQEKFGRITIRSAYRSKKVNQYGNDNNLSCASNEKNYAGHIWDERDADGNLGATSSIVIPRFATLYNQGAIGWQAMAWWIHDNLPYHSMLFFPKNAAFNLNWRENPERWIKSYVMPKGTLTKQGMDNHTGNHSVAYKMLDTF